MQFDILTIFPDLIYHYVNDSILGIAQKKDLIKITAHNWREFATGKHQPVDDTQYGGGAGMVLKVEPIYYCLEAIGALSGRLSSRAVAEGSLKVGSKRDFSTALRSGRNDKKKTKIIILDPAGKKFDQKMAQKFSKLDRLVLISGRYQGFDERIYKFVDEKVSVGDYVLSGGELPALTIVEATARLVPGVLGNAESLDNESHTNQKEYPLYTKPEEFNKLKVPEVLLSGNHKLIGEWRKKKAK